MWAVAMRAKHSQRFGKRHKEKAGINEEFGGGICAAGNAQDCSARERRHE